METQPHHLEALREMFYLGAGRGAGVLNSLLSSPLSLQVSETRVLTDSVFPQWMNMADKKLCLVMMPFSGLLEGDAVLIFPFEDADRLVGAITDRKPGVTTLDTLEIGTLCEIGNIALNGVMHVVSNILGLNLVYQVPSFHQGDDACIQPSRGGKPFSSVMTRAIWKFSGIRTVGYLGLLFEGGPYTRMLERIDELVLEEV